MSHQSTARVDAPVAEVIEQVAAMIDRFGMKYERSDDRFEVNMRMGCLTVSAEDGKTAMTIETETQSRLQDMRDFLTARARDMGFNPHWQGVTKGRPGNFSMATIESVTPVSPAFARVVMSGSDLARFGGGGLHFRLLFGPEGADWPHLDDDGVTQWPGGGMQEWHRPIYTTREITYLHEEGEVPGPARIVMDVFIHEGGRVTEWTRKVQVGEKIGLTGPAGGPMPAPMKWFGIVADETAVPVAVRMLATIGDDVTGEAVLVVPEAADIQDIAHPAGVKVRWALRSEGGTPVDALKSVSIPAEADDFRRFMMFAAERKEAAEAREYLSGTDLARDEMRAVSYWHAGDAEGEAQAKGKGARRKQPA